MLKKNKCFFSTENERGLTSSSANFLANLASEQLSCANEILVRANFVTTKISIIGHLDQIESSRGMNLETFNRLKELIEKQGKLKSFCAWVREALKAKEKEIEVANKFSFNEWLTLMGIPYPVEAEHPLRPEAPVEPEEPKSPENATTDDILETWSIKERARYLEVEAMAATYGKLIHPDGGINRAREILHSKVASPVEAEGNGRETVVKYYVPSIEVPTVDETFNQLQERYRVYEKELNSLKYKIKESIEKLNQDRQSSYREALKSYNLAFENYTQLKSKYLKELDDWRLECNKLTQAFNSELANLKSEYESYKLKLVNETSKLKIRIPESLIGIYQELDSLGK